ncbi:hypothetical protein AIOL_004060 [Candidatus Rhodobacter oscarellae]|uniref:Capsule polysaccharide biosynthesis protein n=1 Tax=Candidatus Rhodobacter oscarellae TaxID=1675527 RepID=A0A0J9EBK3_9RHOB|nr:hypothetical protein [Candidatus Rhodobacter lobularis]KMW59079.1 hypothetical protein AIOL_004060 [Candidatus Rhodobacter lobularis]
MQNLRAAFAGRRAAAEPHALVIHAEGDWFKSIQDGKFDFFTKIVRHATKQGIPSRIVATGSSTSRLLLEQDHINLIVGDQPSYGANRLHALPGYVWGFWYLDEVGVFWNSSMRFSRFNPHDLDEEKAHYFFNGVTSYMLRENVSKAPQEVRMKNPMQEAAAAVFCQEIEDSLPRSHHLTTEQMIRTTASTCKEEPVYVKPHPNQSKQMRKAILDICADYQNVTVSDASVHDLVEASRMVVTQNSAAGFEALMQRRCVITCAKCDYWHATLTPKKTADLREALRFGAEAMSDFPFEKYFYWFLDRNSLEPAKDEFEKRAWARIKEKFFL